MIASVQATRLVWRDNCGAPRVAGKGRERGLGQNAAVKRRMLTESKSHAAWLRSRRNAAAALVTEKGIWPNPAATTSAPAADGLATVAVTLWTNKQTTEVQRQRQVRADRELEAAAFGTVLPAEEGRPELATKAAEEQAAERRRQQASTTKHNRSAHIRARPQLPPLLGSTVWVETAVKDVMSNRDSSWWTPQSCAW